MADTALYVKKKLDSLVSVLRPERSASEDEINHLFGKLRPIGSTSTLVNHQSAIRNRLKNILYNNSSSSSAVSNSLQDLPLQYAKLTKLLNNLEQSNSYLYLSYIFLLPSISFYNNRNTFNNIISVPSYNNNLFSNSNQATISNNVAINSNYADHFRNNSSTPPTPPKQTSPLKPPVSSHPSSSTEIVEHASSKLSNVRNNFWISKELEYVIMKDLLYCLQGLSGKYIKYDSKTEVFLIDPIISSYNFSKSDGAYVSNSNVSPLHPAVHDIVMEICELGWLFKKINEYIQNKIFNEKKIMSSTAAIMESSTAAAAASASASIAAAVSNGIVAQAFGYALQTELQEYYGLLSVLEEEIALGKEMFEETSSSENKPRMNPSDRKGYKLSLLRLVHWLRPCRSRLELLLKMIHTASPLHGGALVSRLAKFSSFLQYEDNKLYYNEEKIGEKEKNIDEKFLDDYESNADREKNQMDEQQQQMELKLNINEVIVENIIVKVCDPYFKQITNWILYGELNDPFNEFFIVKNSSKVMKNIWRENFMINELMLPFFINKALAKKLLNIGKTIDYIKLCLNFLVNNNNTKNNMNANVGHTNSSNPHYGTNSAGLDTLFGSGNILNLFSGNESNFDIESISKILSSASATNYSSSSYKVVIDENGNKKYLRKSNRQINKGKHLTLYGRVVDDSDDEVTRNKKWAKDYEDEEVVYDDDDDEYEEISDTDNMDKVANKNIEMQREIVKNIRKNEKKNEKNIIKILKVLKNIIKNNDIKKYLIQLKYGNNFFFINYLLYYSYYTNKLLLFVLKNYYKLYDYFIALKKFMLLGQGDFFNSLIYLINNELKKKVNNLYHQNLLSILETAIRSSNAQYLPTYITDKITIRFIDNNTGSNKDLGSTETNRNSFETGWDVFSLDYTIRYPLHIIINQQAINSYRTMFHLLWRLKQVEWTQSVTWKQLVSFSHRMDTSFQYITIPLKLYDIFPILSNKAKVGNNNESFLNLKTFFLHIYFNLFIMKNFITNFNSYMMFDVLEGKFQEFEAKFHRANTLDEIIDAHEEYLRDIQYHALLATSSANISNPSSNSNSSSNLLEDKLQKQLQCILINILYYCNLVEQIISLAVTYMSQNEIKPRPFTSINSSKNQEQDLSNRQLPQLSQVFISAAINLGKTVKEYHTHLELFMGLLRQESERSSSEALRFLTFRLDFHNKDDFFTPQSAMPSQAPSSSRSPPNSKSPPNRPTGRA